MYLTKTRVVQQGILLVLSPQTIGPFKNPLHSIMAHHVMRKCEHIFPRDDFSMDWLTKRDLGDRATLSTDVAFLLPFTREELPDEPGRTRIGINVSGLLFGGGYTRKNQFGLRIDYPSFVRELVRRFTANKTNEVWLVGHVNLDGSDEVEDDYRACRNLAAEFPGVRVPAAFASPVHAKNFVSSLDFFVGSRMHATIAAFSGGVPVVPIGYSRKFTGLFGSQG
jgi:colanic acid/amylovoran biosynthesis protein